MLVAAFLFAALAVAVADVRHSLEARSGLAFTTVGDVWRLIGLAAPDDSQSSPQGQSPLLVDGLAYRVASAPAWAAIAAGARAIRRLFPREFRRSEQ